MATPALLVPMLLVPREQCSASTATAARKGSPGITLGGLPSTMEMVKGPGAASVTFTVHSTTSCSVENRKQQSKAGVSHEAGAGTVFQEPAASSSHAAAAARLRSCHPNGLLGCMRQQRQLTACSNRLPTAMEVMVSASATAAK